MFDHNTGDDLLEAETIMQDVVQRRRRVFGPAHPDTLRAEGAFLGINRVLDFSKKCLEKKVTIAES